MAQAVTLDLQIEPGLEIEPEALGGAEEPGQPESRIGADRPLAVHDLVDAAGRHGKALGEPVLGQAEGLEKIVREDLAGVYRPQTLRDHGTLLVIVDDLDVICIALVPPGAHSPLVVDTYAVLPRTISGQPFESVARRHAQVPERGGCVDLAELSQRDALDHLRQLPDGLAAEEALGVLVPEAANHRGMLTRCVNSVKGTTGRRCITSDRSLALQSGGAPTGARLLASLLVTPAIMWLLVAAVGMARRGQLSNAECGMRN